MPKERRRLRAADAKSAINALPGLAMLERSGTPVSPPAAVAHSHVFFWVTQIMGQRDRLLAREFRPLGVRVPEWRVILAIMVRPEISMGETAEYASIDPTTLSRLVEQMLRSGWIARNADSVDLRKTRLTLTKQGRELFEKLWPIADRINRLACEELPEGAAQLMCLGLSTISRALSRAATANGKEQEAEDALAVE